MAQEVFHSMRKKNGNVGWMAIKIDLEKAYDRCRWKFVIDILLDVGFLDNLANLV